MKGAMLYVVDLILCAGCWSLIAVGRKSRGLNGILAPTPHSHW
jgi:hypothetical protein